MLDILFEVELALEVKEEVAVAEVVLLLLIDHVLTKVSYTVGFNKRIGDFCIYTVPSASNFILLFLSFFYENSVGLSQVGR